MFSRTKGSKSAGDDVYDKRYKLSHPSNVYPMNGNLALEFPNPDRSLIADVAGVSIYPDFNPWNHTEAEDNLAVAYTEHGCSESPRVQNEHFSARSIMYGFLHGNDSAAVLTGALDKNKKSAAHNGDWSQFDAGNETAAAAAATAAETATTDSTLAAGTAGTAASAATTTDSGTKASSALASLSKHLIAAMQKRNRFNRISKKNTFKPPPRVTLTEQKKEIWLGNLANSSISLRKLSRTIPHGIRNKALLDHLLSKNVPVTRTIWFIKCIGLNELRSMKRTGPGANSSLASGAAAVMDNEANWIAEWTKQLTNHMQTCLRDKGREFGYRVKYLNNLIRHLFMENLIDKKLYLEWLVETIGKVSLGAGDGFDLYVLIDVFLKSVIAFVMKAFILEGSSNDNSSTEKEYFYTNLLRQLVKHLITKYALVYEKFDLAQMQRTRFPSDANSTGTSTNTPTSAFKLAHTPVFSSLQSPYGLNSINSPFEDPQDASGNSHDAALTEQDSVVPKLKKIIKDLRKWLLVAIRVYLVNLFTLNNGELFLIPKNWNKLKKILNEHNLLNQETTNTPWELPEDTVRPRESTDMFGELDAPVDINVILKNGLSFEVSPTNFVVRNSRKIVLTKHFKVINAKNEALYTSISSSLSEVYFYEKNQHTFQTRKPHQRAISLGSDQQTESEKDFGEHGSIVEDPNDNDGHTADEVASNEEVADENVSVSPNDTVKRLNVQTWKMSKNASFKLLECLDAIVSYEHSYLCVLKQPSMERTTSVASVGKRKKLKKAEDENDTKLSKPESSDESLDSEELYVSNKIDQAINIIIGGSFGDFIKLMTVSSETLPSTPAEDDSGNENESEARTKSLQGIKTRIHLLFKWSICSDNKNADHMRKKTHLMLYILKRLQRTFKQELATKLVANSSAEDGTYFDRNFQSPENEELDDSLSPKVSNVNSPGGSNTGVSKKQVTNNLKAFLQNELLEAMFALNYDLFDTKLDKDKELDEIMASYFSKNSELGTLDKETFSKLDAVQQGTGSTRSLVKLSTENVDLQSLLLLCNAFFELKIITINTYMRKLISSGLLYLRSIESFDELNLWQFFVLRNLNVNILKNSSNSQFSLILKNIRGNFDEDTIKNSQNAMIKKYFETHSLKSIFVHKIDATLNEFKDKLSQLLDPLLGISDIPEFETKVASLATSIECLGVGMQLHLSEWLFKVLNEKLFKDTKVSLTVKSMVAIYEFFKKFNQVNRYFSLMKTLLAIHISYEFAGIGGMVFSNGPLATVKFGYHELYFLLLQMTSSLHYFNFFVDKSDVDVEFENRTSLVIKNIAFQTSVYANLTAFTFLKLIVNNYLRLNDIASGQTYSKTGSVTFLNCYKFADLWRVCLQWFGDRSDDASVNSLNNIKNQLAYLTTEPNFLLSQDENNDYVAQLIKRVPGLNVPVAGFLSVEDFNKTFSQIYAQFKEAFLESECVPSTCEALSELLLILRKVNSIRFESLVMQDIQEIAANEKHEFESVLKFLVYLISYSIMDIRNVLANLVGVLTNNALAASVMNSAGLKEAKRMKERRIVTSPDVKSFPPKLSLKTSDDNPSGSIADPFSVFYGRNFTFLKMFAVAKKERQLMLLFEILFRDFGELPLFIKQSLKIRRSLFKSVLADRYFEILSFYLSDTGHSIISKCKSSSVNTFEEQTLESLINVQDNRNLNLVMRKIVFNNKVNWQRVLETYNKILFKGTNKDTMKIQGVNDLFKLVNLVNEKNLTYCAIILAVLVNIDVKKLQNNGTLKNEEVTKVLKNYLNNILMSCFMLNKTKRKHSITAVGDLFMAMKEEYKTILLSECELLFLNSSEFPKVSLVRKDDGELLQCTFNNFVPYLAVIIESLSKNIFTLMQLNEQLCVALTKLAERMIKLLNNKGRKNSFVMTKSVYVFVHILVIHKASIIHLLYQKHALISDKFINSLVLILKSKFFENDAQLRNMLYDFVFSVRSNLVELSKHITLSTSSKSISLPKLNIDDLNIELTKKLLYRINDTDELAAKSSDKPFSDLVVFDETLNKFYDITFKPFDLLEESNSGININDAPVSLKLFDATIEKKNPP